MIVIQGPFDTHKELFSADLSPEKATKCCTAGTGLYCWYRAVLLAQGCIAGTGLYCWYRAVLQAQGCIAGTGLYCWYRSECCRQQPCNAA